MTCRRKTADTVHTPYLQSWNESHNASGVVTVSAPLSPAPPAPPPAPPHPPSAAPRSKARPRHRLAIVALITACLAGVATWWFTHKTTVGGADVYARPVLGDAPSGA